MGIGFYAQQAMLSSGGSAYDPIPTPVESYPVSYAALPNAGFEDAVPAPWAYLLGDSASMTPDTPTSAGGRTARTGSRFLRCNIRTATSTNGSSLIGFAESIPSAYHADIDAGIVSARFDLYRITGTTKVNDFGRPTLTALNASDVALAQVRGRATNPSAWTLEDLTLPLPPGTRKLAFGMESTRGAGGNAHEIFVDDISRTLLSGVSSATLFEPKALADWTNYGGSDVIFDASSYANTFYGHLGVRFGNASNTGSPRRRWGKKASFTAAQIAAIEDNVVNAEVACSLRSSNVSFNAGIGIDFFDASDVLISSLTSGALKQYAETDPIEVVSGAVPTNAKAYLAYVEGTIGGSSTGHVYRNFRARLTSPVADLL
jgi:hypothetical protein